MRRSIVLVALSAALLAPLAAGFIAGEDATGWTVDYVIHLAEAKTNGSYVPEHLSATGRILLSGTGFSTSVEFNGDISPRENLTGTAQINATYPPVYFRIESLWVDQPIYLVSLLTSQPYGAYDWRFRQEGLGYRFIPVQRPYRQYTFFGTEADLSSIRGSVNQTSTRVSIDIKLMVADGRVVALDWGSSSALMSRIMIETPQAHLLSSDNAFAIVPPWSDELTVSGVYGVTLVALPSPKRVDIPFSFGLSVGGSDNVDAGTQMVSTLRSTAINWLSDDERFFRDALLEDQEIFDRIETGRFDLDEAERLCAVGDVAAFSFAMANGLKLAAQVRETRKDMTFFSVYFIAPVVLCFLLVTSAMVGHLVFNGKPKHIVALFCLALIGSLASHPALRIFALSIKPDLGNMPSIVVTLSLIGGTGYVIFRKAGAQTVYGLAISTAMRMMRARRLRGVLSLMAVCVVATSVVPSVTLRTTSIVSISQTETGSATALPSFALATWLVRIRTPNGDTVTEGLRPLYPGEAYYLANVAGFGDWTSISAARVELASVTTSDRSTRGTLLIAEMDELVRAAGLDVDNLEPPISEGILICSDEAAGFVSQEFVLVNGHQVRVTGSFSSESLLGPDGESLAHILENVPVLTGSFSLGGASASVLGGPLMGILDRGRAAENGVKGLELIVLGTPAVPLDEQRLEDIRTFTLSNRDWVSYQEAELQLMIDAVLSYRFDFRSESTVSTVEATLPLTIAAGTWTSQLVLMLIGGLIVMNVVVNSVAERRKEAITLSSLGASPSFVTNMFVAEGITLGALGGGIGYALGYIASVWLGVSSPAIKMELYTLTPLLLVLFVSLLTTSLGSIFPAKSAILQIVPSREILKREVGEIRFDPSGDALIPMPMRIKTWEWRTFSEFLKKLVVPPTTFGYGLWISDYAKVDGADRLRVEFKAYEGTLAERKVVYYIYARPTSMGEFSGVELRVTGVPEWTEGHRMMLKDTMYELKDELIKFTAFDKSSMRMSPEEEIEEIETHLTRMRVERQDLMKGLRELEWSMAELEDRLKRLKHEGNGDSEN